MMFHSAQDAISYWQGLTGNEIAKREALKEAILLDENELFRKTLFSYRVVTIHDKALRPKEGMVCGREPTDDVMLGELRNQNKPAAENMVGYYAFVQDPELSQYLKERACDEGMKVEITMPQEMMLRNAARRLYDDPMLDTVGVSMEEVYRAINVSFQNQIELIKKGRSEEEIFNAPGNSLAHKYCWLQEGNYIPAVTVLESAQACTNEALHIILDTSSRNI